MDLVGSSKMAGGHDSKQTLVQGEVRELAADLFEEGFQSSLIGHMGSGIQSPDGFDVACRALAPEP